LQNIPSDDFGGSEGDSTTESDAGKVLENWMTALFHPLQLHLSLTIIMSLVACVVLVVVMAQEKTGKHDKKRDFLRNCPNLGQPPFHCKAFIRYF
jgi:hypothetical protein